MKKMNQQIKTGLGVAVILIFAVTTGVFVWYAPENIKSIESVPVKIVKQEKKTDANQANNLNSKGIVYTNSDYGFQLTLPKGWEKYTTSIMFGPENATQISFELPTNDAEWLKNNGGKKTASVFNLVVYPISSKSMPTIPGRKEISKNDKYIVFYDRIDKISDYPKDFTTELFSQADEIIKTFKWSNAVDISNWQTYRNEKYGFEFKYPKDWMVVVGDKSKGEPTVFLKSSDDNFLEVYYTLQVDVSQELEKSENLDQYKEFQKNQGLNYQETIVAGERALRYGDIQTSNIILTDYHFVHRGNGYYVVFKNKYLNIGEQILSTFKFINNQDLQLNIPISELVNNPSLYLNETIQIEALVKQGEDGCYLEDESNKIKVNCWAPDSIAQCPPDAYKGCSPPLSMSAYLNKKVRLSGILKEVERKEYINKEWVVTGIDYVISDVKKPVIIN